jgi:transcriptional regulator with XRE-family HTH domain
VFQEKLKSLRSARGMSQLALAKQLGLSQQTVASWESRGTEPDYATLVRIADIFDVAIDYLLGRDINSDNYTIAAHRSDDPMKGLPKEARERVEEIIELYQASFRSKDNKDKQP